MEELAWSIWVITPNRALFSLCCFSDSSSKKQDWKFTRGLPVSRPYKRPASETWLAMRKIFLLSEIIRVMRIRSEREMREITQNRQKFSVWKGTSSTWYRTDQLAYPKSLHKQSSHNMLWSPSDSIFTRDMRNSLQRCNPWPCMNYYMHDGLRLTAAVFSPTCKVGWVNVGF